MKDKGTTAHNIRKFSMLTSLYMFHKLTHVCQCKGFESEIARVFEKYACMYIELVSCVTDLQMYVIYLQPDARK